MIKGKFEKGKAGMNGSELIKNEGIQNRIYTIRYVQVMLDEDLALLYGVETKVFNQAVKRNRDRFPEEFMFQINNDELSHLKSQIGFSKKDSLRSQNVTLNSARGKHRKYLPYAFTEQGVAMLSAVLRSETAIKVSIQIINAFVAMRKFITINAQIFHFGASLKDLGKKWFAFSKLEKDAFRLMERLNGK